MAAYTHNRESANDAVLEGSPVGSGIEKLMVTVSAFEGTMTGLLKELEVHVDEEVKSQRNWPRNPSALTPRAQSPHGGNQPPVRGTGYDPKQKPDCES